MDMVQIIDTVNQASSRSQAKPADEMDLSHHKISRLRFNADDRIKTIQSILRSSLPRTVDLENVPESK